jgi:hypothetical protein
MTYPTAAFDTPVKLQYPAPAAGQPSARLSLTDLAIFTGLGKYKYLSTKQIRHLYFSHTHHRSVSRRMNRLRASGFCDVRYVYTTENDLTAHGQKDAIWFLQPQSVRNIREHLVSRGQFQLMGELLDVPYTDREKRVAAPSQLRHEVNLAWILIHYTASAELTGNPIIFFEQTSRVREIEESFENSTITTQNRTHDKIPTFKPDGVVMEQNSASGAHLMPFIEYDNNTESMEEWRTKVSGYLRYHAAGRVPGLIRYFSDCYNLGYSDEFCSSLGADFIVLTVTKDRPRRNKLLRETSRLPDSEQRRHFYFAALEDLSPQTIRSAVWLNADDYRPTYDEELRLPQQIKPSVKAGWIHDQVAILPRVAF